MDPTVAIIVIIALLLGLGAGWFLGSRGAAPLRDELTALRERCGIAERESASSGAKAARADELQRLLDAVIVERDQASRDSAGLRPVADRVAAQDAELTKLRGEKEALTAEKAAHERGEAERRDAFEAQLKIIKDLEAKLETRFGDLAGKALETAHDAFLKRAQLSLGQTGAQNEAKLKELLQPVQSTLSRYEAGLRALEHDRKGAYEGLNARIAMLSEGQERVANEALRLRTALRSSTGDVGRWGEDQCRNILENAGMQEGIDFEQQVSTDVLEDQSKPDFVVNLPGNRKLIIDVKCSVDAYLGAEESDDTSIKEKFLKEHAKAIRNHANSLGKRAYQDKINRSLSFIVMFIPGENFLYAAIKRDKKLLRDAQNNKISIVGPSNLLGIILNAAALRDQARLAERAEEIGALGRRLYENLSTLGKNAHGMSSAMRSIVSNWNKLVGTIDGHWLTTARKFDELGVGKGSDDIREINPIELEIREPSRLGSMVANSDNSSLMLKDANDSSGSAGRLIAGSNEDDAAV